MKARGRSGRRRKLGHARDGHGPGPGAAPEPELSGLLGSLWPAYNALRAYFLGGHRLGLELLDFNPEPNPTGWRLQRPPQLWCAAYPKLMSSRRQCQTRFTSPGRHEVLRGEPAERSAAAQFTHAVLNHVQETFRLSGGLTPKITLDLDSNQPHAERRLRELPTWGTLMRLGITNVGSNGFSFIDKLSYGSSGTPAGRGSQCVT